MENKFKLGDKEVIVREMGYLDAIELEEAKKTGLKEAIKKLLKITTNLTDEEIDSLNVKQGIDLQKLINEVNGFADFRQPTVEGVQS
jgi:hypothetical protein